MSTPRAPRGMRRAGLLAAVVIVGGALPSLLTAGCYGKTVIDHEPSPDAAFPDNAQPLSIPKGGIALVTNNGSDTLSVLDLDANTVVRTVLVAIDPIAANGPHHVAVDPVAGAVFTPLAFPAPAILPGPHGAHGAATRPGLVTKLRLSDLTRETYSTVEANPGDIRLTPDGATVLVSHYDLKRATDALAAGKPVEDMRASVMLLDAKSLLVRATVPTCVAPHGMDLSPDGKTAYVACYGEDAIGVIHLDSPEILTKPANAVERFPVGPGAGPPGRPLYGPYSVSVAGGQLLVGETVSKSLDVLDIATHAVVHSIATRGEAYFSAPTADATTWVVPTQGPDQILRVDVAAGTVKLTNVPADGGCVRPHQAARFGARTFVVCEGDHVKPGRILEIDETTLETIRSFDVGIYPDSIAFVPGAK